jgi:alanine dehydrogenase
VDGVLHYCVANIPGNYPITSTQALSNATIGYARHIADLGWRQAVLEDDAIYSGVNVAGGFVTNEPVAKTHGTDYHELRDIMDQCPAFKT